MGNTVTQYRAAIGNFYMSNRVIIKHACFTVLRVDICLVILCMITLLKSVKRYSNYEYLAGRI